MSKEIVKSVEEVNRFLTKTKKLLENEDDWHVNVEEWAGKVNKTRAFMAETGLGRKEIKQIVSKLSVNDYCYTRDDKNVNFPDEQFWFFGISENIIDEELDLYIKLKIRKIEDEFLLVMSFHPEQPVREEDKLQFPYKTG